MKEILLVENDRRKKMILLEKLETHGATLGREICEALKPLKRGFLGSNNRVKDKRFHLVPLRLTVPLIFLLKPSINDLYVMF
jgi:hypothetical protein